MTKLFIRTLGGGALLMAVGVVATFAAATMSASERRSWIAAAQEALDGDPRELADMIEAERAMESYREFTDRLTERESELWGNEFPQWSERQPMVAPQVVS